MSFLIFPREFGITSGSGRGGDSRGGRQSSRRRNRNIGRESAQNSSAGFGNFPQGEKQTGSFPRKTGKNADFSGQSRGDSPRFDKTRGTIYERPKWIPPKLSTEPLPQPECPWCGKTIRDITIAVQDKDTGLPVHFDCVLARIVQGENLERGDSVSYLGGGRFGVVHFGSPNEVKKFIIKKIFEWENKDNRAEWRDTVSDHYSMT